MYLHTHTLCEFVKLKLTTRMRKYSLNEDLTDKIFEKQDFKITVLPLLWLNIALFLKFWFIKLSSGKNPHNNIVEHEEITSSTE